MWNKMGLILVVEFTDRRYPYYVSNSHSVSPEATARVIAEALPYIQKFAGQTFVIKYGGSAMQERANMISVVRNVLLLQSVGIQVVMVHGGGPEINKLTQRLNLPQKSVRGLRVTDSETMEAVEMALCGKANKSLVSAFNQEGGRAVGLSGRDAKLLIAEPIDPELGRVGKVVESNTDILDTLLESGYLPIVSSVAEDELGEPLNINADEAASSIAIALSASKFIMLTDTPGVLADKNDDSSTISLLSVEGIDQLIESGKADRGMIPKLVAASDAAQSGVEKVHLINGGLPNALLIELFTEQGIGTMVCGADN